MPKSRPQLSITLPRNFAFHCNEGDPPRTPDQKTDQPQTLSPQAEGAFRIKRRSRPGLNALSFGENSFGATLENHVLESIESPSTTRPLRPLFRQSASTPRTGFGTVAGCVSLPRTPEPDPQRSQSRWGHHYRVEEAISRPLSACSLMTDSSDNTDSSFTSYPTGNGSCTSPESDAPDPFRLSSQRNKKSASRHSLSGTFDQSRISAVEKLTSPHWTPEMDQHLWTTYLLYVQDPTVTPFKMLPGVAPPLGVCHRVAREARKTWRGGRTQRKMTPSLLSPFNFQSRSTRPSNVESPETIRAVHGVSMMPTECSNLAIQPWPKIGSHTRRRLRFLCKRKPSIAPHYQRLLQSRSPSPFSSSSTSLSRSQSRLSEVSTPVDASQFSFNTRDVQLSLLASTADSMQPNGPLAQLNSDASNPEQNGPQLAGQTAYPFASEIPIPSDLASGDESESYLDATDASATPRLGSPCGFHTWGPSRTKARFSSRTPRARASEAATVGPSLLSPLEMRRGLPHPGAHKRRAHNQLDETSHEMNSTQQQARWLDRSKTPTQDSHRRVRGFSLGDLQNEHPLQTLFAQPGTSEAQTDLSPTLSLKQAANTVACSSPGGFDRRLDSPFHGISPRPQRRAARHLATFSLGRYDHNVFSSISETLKYGEGIERSPPAA